MRLDRAIGQEKARANLVKAFESGKLGHAILFTGPPGCGKDALALEMARIMNCADPGETSCGVCASCKRFKTLQHPNLTYLFPLPGGKQHKDDPLYGIPESVLEIIHEQLRIKGENHYHSLRIPGANVIKISSIRAAKQGASLSHAEAGKKVILISGAEKMNDESANSILKLLEEPPRDTFLFLTTAKPQSLKPTIRSRCQQLKLRPLKDAEVAEVLRSRDVSDEKLQIIVSSVGGDLGRALKMLEEDEYSLRMEMVSLIEKIIVSGTPSEISSLSRSAQALAKEDREALIDVLKMSAVKITQRAESDADAWAESLDIAKRFDKAVDLIERNVYIPMIFTSLVLETREMHRTN